jgi:uncharacterized membrane protein YccC
MMDFIVGMILGLVIGGLIMHMAHEYFDHLLSKDDEK